MESKDLALALKVMRDDLMTLFELSIDNNDKYLDEIAEIQIALTKIEIQEGICQR